MDNRYTQSFNIPAGGWTGQASAILNCTTTNLGITCSVRLWRDNPSSPPRILTMRPGEIIPIKVRYVFHNQGSIGLAGFN